MDKQNVSIHKMTFSKIKYEAEIHAILDELDAKRGSQSQNSMNFEIPFT